MAALLATPGLPVPGADRLGLGGSALAQENIDIDTFYDELEPYGQWVWHPRFGYVWLPEDVSPDWRPYTVGHWVSTEEYGWYWESNEPFAWAVYHYGRWGYDPDYGWFWVPGDTWAPAWVQWRYDDQYVGWAPIGPRRAGLRLWRAGQLRAADRQILGVRAAALHDLPGHPALRRADRRSRRRVSRRHAMSIGRSSAAAWSTITAFRATAWSGSPGVRSMCRRSTRSTIGRAAATTRTDHGNGIRVYAPGVHKGDGHRGPKKFADHPNQFKPKAKLKHTFKGEPPKGFGRSAKDVKSIAKQDPDAFKQEARQVRWPATRQWQG